MRSWMLAAVPLAGAAMARPPENQRAELDAAWHAAAASAVRGPARVPLLDQGSLTLTADEIFIPAGPAGRIMTAMANPPDPARFGLVVSRREGADWLIDIDWIKEGYVRDGEAKDWQLDALFANLKDATEQANAGRIAKGVPALDLTGWVEPPAYDAAAHRLVWSLAARERGAPADRPQTVNYNTYALGRDGYFALDLITDARSIGADKQAARDLLGTLDYAPGKRYADFNGSTDKVATYGIAALIGVVAVKKLGLLAMAGVFLLKVWKLGLLALAAGSAAVRRFFGRGKAADDRPVEG